MKIVAMDSFDEATLLDSLARTRLVGHDRTRIYAKADLQLLPRVHTDTLVPAQRYALRPGVAKVIELREAMLAEGVDLFGLAGGAYVRTSDDPDEIIPVIPPIVEESMEPDGRTVRLINDGIHRVYAARSLGLPISIVLVRNVPPELPYYALALPGGWADVLELDELPDSFLKKEYRRPDNYKSLFRDFNEVFPGVQKVRKQSNPSHVKE
jgi:hypothetical protein